MKHSKTIFVSGSIFDVFSSFDRSNTLIMIDMFGWTSHFPVFRQWIPINISNDMIKNMWEIVIFYISQLYFPYVSHIFPRKSASSRNFIDELRLVPSFCCSIPAWWVIKARWSIFHGKSPKKTQQHNNLMHQWGPMNHQNSLLGGLEHLDYFSIYWECHHPNWRTHMFQRGRSTTSQIVLPLNHWLFQKNEWIPKMDVEHPFNKWMI